MDEGARTLLRRFICRAWRHKPATMTFTCLRCGEYTVTLAEQIARTRRGN